MDLQLYRVDADNYLVDFRNIGYYNVYTGEAINPENARSPPMSQSDSHESHHPNGAASPPPNHVNTMPKMRLSKGPGQEGIGGVSGPFHFLEMACQLIAELANG